MKLITWNINSIRLRMPLLQRLVADENPDIICLQETKVRDELFPLEDTRSLGFEHVIFRGEKGYNGVAILSKYPLEKIQKHNIAGVEESRHISATLPDGTELHNLYIPAGGDEPDTAINPKFKYKLDFVDDLTRLYKEYSKQDKLIILGDFNIAPKEHDVWSHKQLLKVVSHTPIEVEKLSHLQQSLSWIDVSRHFVPESEKLYSWWSYRNKDWRKSNRGRRLDHIWITPACTSPQSHTILTNIRDWPQPSDHVPIVVTF